MADNVTTQAAPAAPSTPAAPAAPAATETSTQTAPSTWSSWADVESHPAYSTLDDGVKSFWRSGAEAQAKRAADLEAEAQRYLQLVSEANPDLGEYRKRAEAGDKYKSDYEKATAELTSLRAELEAAKAAGASKAELDAIKAEVAASKAEVEAARGEATSLKTKHEEAMKEAFLDTALHYHEAVAEAFPQLVKTEKDADGTDTYVWASEAAKAVFWQLVTKDGASIAAMPSVGAVMKEMSRLVAQPENPSKQAMVQNGGSGGAGGSLGNAVEVEATAIVNNAKMSHDQKAEALNQLALKHRLSQAQKDGLYELLYPDLAKLRKR